jgi:hypothetical protein
MLMGWAPVCSIVSGATKSIKNYILTLISTVNDVAGVIKYISKKCHKKCSFLGGGGRGEKWPKPYVHLWIIKQQQKKKC